jgi:hypothetical protein
MTDPELKVKLHPMRHRVEYTEAEGRRSYAYVLSQHPEWSVTPTTTTTTRGGTLAA